MILGIWLNNILINMKKWYKNLIWLTLLLFCLPLLVNSQTFEYRKIKNIPDFIQTFNEKSKISELKKTNHLVDITKYLPKNYKKDGTEDYTAFVQKALNENRSLLMPNFPILINDKGLDIPNNTLLVFNVKSLIKLSPSSKTNYQILRIHNKKNIEIYSPKIVGDRYQHLNTKGEWGMGISIVSSTNINIYNANIRNCWGDGIYLGQNRGITNKDIKILYGLIDNNRRNGISVISVDGLEISNLIISNTNGTSPESGLDFEPNNNNEMLNNITVNNLYTYNNKTNGVVFYLARLRGAKQKNILININNHTDRYSLISLGFSSTEIPNVKNKMDNIPLKGNIILKNVDSYNSKYPFRVYKGTLNEGVNIDIYPKDNLKYKNISIENSFKKVNIK